MTSLTNLRSRLALRSLASALLLAGAFASGSAMAAAAGDPYALTLSYDPHFGVVPPSVGSFVLGPELAAHPGVFSVASFTIVIGVAPNAWNYDEIHAELDFDTATGQFGGGDSASHAFSSYGDQLDLNSTFGTWKTDDFDDPHCDSNGCADFWYGTYAVAPAAPAVPEPGSAALTLAGAGLLSLFVRRQRRGR